RLWINRARAEKLGLDDGDLVQMTSLVGEGKIRIRLTEGLHPSCVWLPSGYGIFSKHLATAYDQGVSYNDFLPTRFDPAVGHAMASEIIVTVKKA
ncbi:MAG: dehydrogenase, partial [Deltaproteobacteria bacterium]|nr:dehydrogenase [Deltaproteobacteria bacterium]